ncbi:MAG: 30S ribosomal protein S12 methylthiotransferase RimO [Erysipelotrichaceae bacterium]
MKFGFISLGCCKNLVDSEKMMGLLKSYEQEIVSDPQDADVIVVNTCGFIESAKEESINTILEMAEYGKKLIVTGCLAQRYLKELREEMQEVDCFIPLQDYDQFGSILSNLLGIQIPNEYGKTARLIATKPWVGYLKIADGCSNRCSYCAIPLIRGNYRSFKIEDLIEEAKTLLASGVKELVVIAQDTTRYGEDLYGKRCLIELLRQLNELHFHWIRVLYMYPDEIDEELIIGMKTLDRVLPYFDIPVQYGEDEMLKLMNRRGSVESILETIKTIRTHYALPALRTTLIVGFPHETEETFEQTLSFMKVCKWDRLGAFTYSKEEDTPAYTMDHEVSEADAERRLKQIMDLQESIVVDRMQALVGETLEVLVENYDGLTSRYLGRSIFSAPDGIDGLVYFRSDEKYEMGSFANVKITKVDKHDLFGEVM